MEWGLFRAAHWTIVWASCLLHDKNSFKSTRFLPHTNNSHTQTYLLSYQSCDSPPPAENQLPVNTAFISDYCGGFQSLGSTQWKNTDWSDVLTTPSSFFTLPLTDLKIKLVLKIVVGTAILFACFPTNLIPPGKTPVDSTWIKSRSQIALCSVQLIYSIYMKSSSSCNVGNNIPRSVGLWSVNVQETTQINDMIQLFRTEFNHPTSPSSNNASCCRRHQRTEVIMRTLTSLVPFNSMLSIASI